MMNPEIFRQYDIRGIAGKDMTETDVIELGQGIGTFLIGQGHHHVTVGRDCRTTSESYSRQLIQGLTSTGCNVVDIGLCSTPVSYFSIRHLQKEGGVMVTASHNPPQYNGFKISSGTDSVYGEQIQQIRRLIENQAFAVGQGRLEYADIIPDYIDYIVRNIHVSRPLRIAVDAGNGTAGITALPIFEKLGCQVVPLYCEMDGTFPNHEADPTVAENMKDLIQLVRSQQLDLGFGFDGDGDRVGVIDNRGNMIFGDQLMVIFSREILARKKGATFISEVKCSKTMYDDIEAHGGKAVMWKTGHSLIKQKMKALKAELAGEMSGHIFFSDRYLGYDDAVYAACRLIEIIADTGKSVGELLADLPTTFTTPEIRVDCADDIKFSVVRRVTDHFRARQKVIDIDGVRVLYPDGWGLVRASNTQPALVLRFEAMTQNRLEEIRMEVEGALNEIVNG